MNFKNEKCRRFRDLIQQKIDGYILPVEDDMLNNHLLQCEKCSEYYKKIKNMKNLISEVKFDAPDYMESKVMSKINEIENKKEQMNWLNILRPSIVYAFSFLFIFSLTFIFYNKIDNTKDMNFISNIQKLSVLPAKIYKSDINKEKIIKKDNITKNKLYTHKINKNEKNMVESKQNKKNINLCTKNINNAIIPKKVNNKETYSPQIKTIKKTMNFKYSKTEPTPVYNNPLLEKEKVIVGNNLINPLRGESAIIKIKVEETSKVKIVIYDKRIREVIKLCDEEKLPGIYEIRWSGRTPSNEIVAEGIYFVYIQIGNRVIKKKIIVIK